MEYAPSALALGELITVCFIKSSLVTRTYSSGREKKKTNIYWHIQIWHIQYKSEKQLLCGTPAKRFSKPFPYLTNICSHFLALSLLNLGLLSVFISKYRISFPETLKMYPVMLPDTGSNSTNIYWVTIMYQTLSHCTNNEKTGFSKNIVIFFNSWDSFGIPARNNNYQWQPYFMIPKWSSLISFITLKIMYWFFGYLQDYFW